ncbi:hypothetical protein [Streptomyces sp. NPDC006971]|uniref:hypothetical protein n=1 Tax=Streptomyces sp. NPDC006971 TaxID=3154784 RepID=UPI0033C7CA42
MSAYRSSSVSRSRMSTRADGRHEAVRADTDVGLEAQDRIEGVETVGEDAEALQRTTGGAVDGREAGRAYLVGLQGHHPGLRDEFAVARCLGVELGADDRQSLALQGEFPGPDIGSVSVGRAVGDPDQPRSARPFADVPHLGEERGAFVAPCRYAVPFLDVPPQQLAGGRAVDLVGEPAVEHLDVVRERLERDRDPGTAVRAVVREVQRGPMVHALVLQLGQRVPGDQAAHAEPADGQWCVAPPLGDRTHDRGLRGPGIVQNRRTAFVVPEEDHVVSPAAQFADERVVAELQALPGEVQTARPGVESVGQDHGPYEIPVPLAEIHPGGAARQVPHGTGRQRKGAVRLGLQTEAGSQGDRRLAPQRRGDLLAGRFGHRSFPFGPVHHNRRHGEHEE